MCKIGRTPGAKLPILRVGYLKNWKISVISCIIFNSPKKEASMQPHNA